MSPLPAGPEPRRDPPSDRNRKHQAEQDDGRDADPRASGERRHVEHGDDADAEQDGVGHGIDQDGDGVDLVLSDNLYMEFCHHPGCCNDDEFESECDCVAEYECDTCQCEDEIEIDCF